MKVKSMGHTGICVKNLEKSIEFYCGVMGLKVVEEPGDMVLDPEEGRGLGFEDCTHRICLLEVTEGQYIELMEFGRPESPIERPMPLNAIGTHHVSYVVDDIQAWVNHLKEKGMEFIYKPLPYETDNGTAYWVLFKDPDGIAVELMQL